MLTGPQAQSEECREGKFSISCRKLKDHFLVVHYVSSTLTQTETSNYYTYLNQGFSLYSACHIATYCKILDHNISINNFFEHPVFFDLRDYFI